MRFENKTQNAQALPVDSIRDDQLDPEANKQAAPEQRESVLLMGTDTWGYVLTIRQMPYPVNTYLFTKS